jgi:hypothetical protein
MFQDQHITKPMLKPQYLVHCDLFNKICLFVCIAGTNGLVRD